MARGRWLTAYLAAASRHLLDTDGMRERLADAVPAHTACPGGDGTPVVLVHGYLARKSCWLEMIGHLHRAGHHHIRTASYSVFRHGVEQAAKRVHDKVVRVAEQHGVDRVDVVGHSMGGIATLYAACRFGLDAHLRNVVTLGTPYGGSPLARIALGGPQLLATARQLAPSSPLLAELRDQARDLRVPWSVMYSPADELVPVAAARLDDAPVTHVPTPPVGHAEMLFSRRVARLASAQLAA